MVNKILGYNPIKKKITSQHATDLLEIDYDLVRQDILALLTSSQPSWPADYGNYGPLFIRLAWHAAGSYRTSDGRGGADGGRQRFDPERSWADNTNLDKARSLLVPIKEKYGHGLSWGDLLILAGDTAIESMGGPILGFCGGRIDDVDGSQSDLLGPTKEQETLYPCLDKDQNAAENGACKSPLGATTVGLIYVNPEGPMANPDPKGSVVQVRDTFDRMNMNDSETIALIGGGHAFGKTHGACRLAPGPSPKEDEENPWPGNCGEGAMKGRGVNTFTSGFDFPWTTIPTRWNNQFFTNLLSFNWTLIDRDTTPGGHYEWHVDETSVKSPEAGTADGTGKQKIGMLTTDVSLLEDEVYLGLLETYASDMDAFNEAFKNAWYKLTTRDMGPITRCLGSNIPPPQEWQYPLPESEDNLADWEEVKKDVRSLFTQENKGSFARLAWQCMSTFRSTDYLGGCNGARIRFDPQSAWDVNIGMPDVISHLQPIKERYGNSLSWGDLIILAGNAEIEYTSGRSITFCGGRTDAVLDGGASDNLAPRIMGRFEETNVQLKEFMGLMGLTLPEYAALHGAGYAMGQGGTCAGLYCKRDYSYPSQLSNIFFKNIVEHQWIRNETFKMYTTKDNIELRMSSADVQFYFDPILKAVAEDYASDDALFLEKFEQAWTTLANADRFDGPFGNVCDTEDETNNGYGNTLHRLNILTFIITLFLLYEL